MKITIEEIKEAYKKICYSPMSCETIDTVGRFCCPLAAYSLAKGHDEISIISDCFSNFLDLDEDFISGFIAGIDEDRENTEDIVQNLFNNHLISSEYFDGYKNGLEIKKALEI